MIEPTFVTSGQLWDIHFHMIYRSYLNNLSEKNGVIYHVIFIRVVYKTEPCKGFLFSALILIRVNIFQNHITVYLISVPTNQISHKFKNSINKRRSCDKTLVTWMHPQLLAVSTVFILTFNSDWQCHFHNDTVSMHYNQCIDTQWFLL